jgi:hypothetical protein
LIEGGHARLHVHHEQDEPRVLDRGLDLRLDLRRQLREIGAVSTISTSRCGVPGGVSSGASSSMSAVTRSRVTPGTGATIETRCRAKRLSRLDLPTLGRPTMAICGTLMNRRF